VDPLADQFPWVSSFNYAENMVPMAVDLYGLQAYFIHGLRSSGEDWNSDAFTKVKETLKHYTNNVKEYSAEFSWKSGPAPRVFTRAGSKGRRQRTRGARELVNFIESTFVEGEDITLIGVSDGGNVAIQAARLLNNKYGVKVNIITVNTPGNSVPGDLENPNGNQGINDLIEISTWGDWVVEDLGGGVQNPGLFGKWEELMLYPKELSEGEGYPGAVHATENIDLEQIKEAGLQKLSRVPNRFRLTEDKLKN
jgi:pimeloyl-ACP methyl ester carboxylesterase